MVERRFLLSSSLLLFVVICLSMATADAAKRKYRNRLPARLQTSLVVDGRSGKILHAANARVKIYPASLTKLMTLYLIFEALDTGKLYLSQRLHVSRYASKAQPLKLYLRTHERITVRDIILGLIVRSANDAAIVAAEGISGSEQEFAKLMTMRAKHLGMQDTIFTNASGLHHPRQVSTAVDLTKLSMAIKRDFPQYYHLFKRTSFTFRKKIIRGHNSLVATYPGAEGLKTGFTTPAGCNLITTATRGNKSLVAVVTGSNNSQARNQKMVRLLDQHFGITHRIILKKQPIKKRINTVLYRKNIARG